MAGSYQYLEQIIYLNFMKGMNKDQICLLCIWVILGKCQEIVDFTYSKYVHNQNAKDLGKNSQILIHPKNQLVGGYEFPEACLLAKKINEQVVEDSSELQNWDTDTMVDELKKQFVELLRVSEKIRKKKNNLADISNLSGRNSNTSSVQPHDLELLRKYEQKLAALNDQIKHKSDYLETLVYDSIKNTQNNQFVISALDYEIEFLGLKLDYLARQQRQAALADSSAPEDTFAIYFKDLKKKFDEENQLVNDLNTIIENYNQIGILKNKINRLKGEVQISDLMLEEKEICAKERDEIRKFQRNQVEIKALMTNLREKKKDRNNINNMYCEGVVKKLEDRVKKVLMTYDYTFECADGLEELRNKRDEHKRDLAAAWSRLKQLEDNTGMDDYKIKFEENRRYIQTKHQEMSTLALPQYHHNVEDLEKLIGKTQQQLADARSRRNSMNRPVQKKNTDFKAIHELVDQIKSLKGQYCFQYSRYETKAQELWNYVHQFEAQLSYQSKMRDLYNEEVIELRGLEMVFHELRLFITSKIK